MNQRDRIRMIWSLILSYDYESDNGPYRDWKESLSPMDLAAQQKAEDKICSMLMRKCGRQHNDDVGPASADGYEIYDREVLDRGY